MWKKIVSFFGQHRLLDGYISILGLTLHYKLLATYGESTFYLISFSLSKYLHFDVTYHAYRGHYPAITSSLVILLTIYDTADKAKKSVKSSLAEYDKNSLAKRKLIEEELGSMLDLAKKWSRYSYLKG